MVLNLFKKNKKTLFMQNKKSLFDSWANAKTVQGFFSAIDNLPNPDIVLRNAGKSISVLSNLENHYQVGACIESRKAGTTSVNWELKENNCQNAHFDFYKEIIQALDIHKLIEDILDAPLYGFNPIEILWQKEGNYIYPIELNAKPQEWFYFNSEGEFFFKDRNHGGKLKIDLNSCKFLLPRNRPTYKNPYGKAILSRCFWNVAFIQGGMEFWVKFAEKYGMPYLIGKYERSLSDKEQNELLESLAELVQDAIATIPVDSTVEMMNTGSTQSSAIYSDLITKCENNISKAILGQTLTTDIGSSGSYAASNTHMSVRQDIIESDKLLVENTINTLIKFINYINFNDDAVPLFNFISVQDLGVDKAQRDNLIKSLGVKFSEEYLLRTYGYEKGDIQIIENSENTLNYSDDESISQTDNLLSDKNLQESVEDSLKEIMDFFNKSKSPEKTLEKLEELYPDLTMDKLEEKLAKVIFISELMGRYDSQKRI